MTIKLKVGKLYRFISFSKPIKEWNAYSYNEKEDLFFDRVTFAYKNYFLLLKILDCGVSDRKVIKYFYENKIYWNTVNISDTSFDIEEYKNANGC